MRVQKNIPEKFFKLLSYKSNLKFLFIFNVLISVFIFDLVKAESDNSSFEIKDNIQIDYLKSKEELKDYIIDTGDILTINFNYGIFNGDYSVNPEGEILLPEINETYVRGLTPSELSELLTKKYLEFMNDPEITVRIAKFKPLRISIQGEVRNPGTYKFPSYSKMDTLIYGYDQLSKQGNQSNIENNKIESINSQFSNDNLIKKNTDKITTISNAIRRAGGTTSKTDLSRIEIIRDIPIGQGGGKKRAIVDFTSFINQSDPTNDIRLFDGDRIFIPKLASASSDIIPKSILSGLSPKFITVDIFGRVANPGTIKLPLESALSDAINLTGPIKPLSGKINLIRYNIDGTILNKKISYSARAKKGSKNNPFVKEGDLISVNSSLFGKSTGVIKELTAPFVGIYSTKKLIENF